MNKSLFSLTVGLLLLVFAPTIFAADTTTNSLPYEDWLKTIQKSLTGPVAFSVSLIGMVSAGASLIFMGGEMGRFMRTMIYLALVMTLLVGANNLMTSLFNGAVIDRVENTVNASTHQDKASVIYDELKVNHLEHKIKNIVLLNTKKSTEYC